jgi:hypothetical protein
MDLYLAPLAAKIVLGSRKAARPFDKNNKELYANGHCICRFLDDVLTVILPLRNTGSGHFQGKTYGAPTTNEKSHPLIPRHSVNFCRPPHLILHL